MSCSCKKHAVVSADLGRALAEQCEAQNRYPADVARDWLILNPFGGTHFTMGELIDLCDQFLVEAECRD